MKRFGIALALISALFTSCVFDFASSSKILSSADDLHCVTATSDSVQVTSYFNKTEVLQYYEESYIAGPARLIDQVQKYSASGVLESSVVYVYNPDNQAELVAYFDGTNALQWYQTYTYDTSKVAVQAEYDGSGALQWARKYSYVASGDAIGKIETAASFSAASVLDGLSVYTFLSGSDKWNKEVSYGTNRNAVDCASVSVSLEAGAKTQDVVTSHGKITLALPAKPADPALVLPADPAAVLALSGYRFAYYDGYGSSEISLTPEWYPTTVLRTDTRLEGRTLRVDLEYDGSNRIIGKNIFYGTTRALSVIIEYDAAGFPVKISTTGEAMMLPLEYSLTYDSHHRPQRVSISSALNLLQYFDYTYAGTALTLSASTDRSIDPFAFLDTLLTSVATVKQYDGDDKLVETFTAHSVAGGVSLEVTKPDNTFNGYFLVTLGASGKASSLASFDANGTKQAFWEFGFADAALESLGPGQFGRLVETCVPSGSGTVSSAIADNFKYDLMF